MKKKTLIVLVEDNTEKANSIITTLEREGVEYYQLSALNPALKFITKEFKKIDGIILDLGLPRFENGRVENIYSGLEIIEELKSLEINIPILINSSTLIDIDEKEFPFVFTERMFSLWDTIALRNFLQSISEQEEQ